MMNEWCSIDDRQPDKGQIIAAYGPDVNIRVTVYTQPWDKAHLTHWLPCPMPYSKNNAGEWVSVKERWPDADRLVWVCKSGCEYSVEIKGGKNLQNGLYYGNYSHWALLPELPQQPGRKKTWKKKSRRCMAS